MRQKYLGTDYNCSYVIPKQRKQVHMETYTKLTQYTIWSFFYFYLINKIERILNKHFIAIIILQINTSTQNHREKCFLWQWIIKMLLKNVAFLCPSSLSLCLFLLLMLFDVCIYVRDLPFSHPWPLYSRIKFLISFYLLNLDKN